MFTLKNDQLELAFPELHRDARLVIEFQRTLRIPDDNRAYPLPPGLGQFPMRHVDDYAAKVPSKWREHGGVFLPMYQAEALWISFRSAQGYPFAVKIAAGKMNAVSGASWTNDLDFDDQDYVVVPDQPWLDGFCVSQGKIRQFVAMPLGAGYTVEEQLTGESEHGGIQIIAYPLKPERYDPPPSREGLMLMEYAEHSVYCASAPPEMGLAPGGVMEQHIYEDEHRHDDWRTDVHARCFVHLLNSAQYHYVTGEAPPTQPPTAKHYTDAGLPWFEYYKDAAALDGGVPLKVIDSVAALGIKKGESPLLDNSPVAPANVRKLGATNIVRDGEF